MDNFRKWITTLSLALLLVGATTAFGQSELVVAQGIDIPGFDIHDHNTTAVEAIHVNFFDYLLMMDAEGVRQPALATSWEPIAEDAWQFSLREGVLWHDGEPFTAADVKFTLERVAFDNTLLEHNSYNQIREVEIVNDHEIIIHTHGPDPILLNRLSRIGSGILPKHYIDEVGWDEFSINPIGTGPYRFVSWQRDDRLIMEAFEDHWRGRPAYDRVVHRTIPEDSTRVNELLTGGVHIATNIPPQEEERVAASSIAHPLPWPSPRVMMFIINTDPAGSTGDPLVREAIEYAIDNQLLIDALMDGNGTPVRARLTPGISAAPMTYYDTYLYDPERAVELLAEAGYGPGELTVKIQGSAGRYPKDAEISELVSLMLEEVGINAPIEVLEWSAYLQRIWDPKKIDNLALIGLSNSMFDAWQAASTFTCDSSYFGRTNWCNEEYDQLIKATEVEMDPDVRAGYFVEAFDILADARPMTALYQLENVVGVSNDVDWAPRPDELIWLFDAHPVEGN